MRRARRKSFLLCANVCARANFSNENLTQRSLREKNDLLLVSLVLCSFSSSYIYINVWGIHSFIPLAFIFFFSPLSQRYAVYNFFLFLCLLLLYEEKKRWWTAIGPPKPCRTFRPSSLIYTWKKNKRRRERDSRTQCTSARFFPFFLRYYTHFL